MKKLIMMITAFLMATGFNSVSAVEKPSDKILKTVEIEKMDVKNTPIGLSTCKRTFTAVDKAISFVERGSCHTVGWMGKRKVLLEVYPDTKVISDINVLLKKAKEYGKLDITVYDVHAYNDR